MVPASSLPGTISANPRTGHPPGTGCLRVARRDRDTLVQAWAASSPRQTCPSPETTPRVPGPPLRALRPSTCLSVLHRVGLCRHHRLARAPPMTLDVRTGDRRPLGWSRVGAMATTRTTDTTAQIKSRLLFTDPSLLPIVVDSPCLEGMASGFSRGVFYDVSTFLGFVVHSPGPCHLFSVARILQLTP